MWSAGKYIYTDLGQLAFSFNQSMTNPGGQRLHVSVMQSGSRCKRRSRNLSGQSQA